VPYTKIEAAMLAGLGERKSNAPAAAAAAAAVCRDVSAADAASSQPLVTFPEIEAAMLAGLGERKRVKTLKKLRKNLRQMQDADSASTAAAADGEGEEEGSGEDSWSAAAGATAASEGGAAGGAAGLKPGDSRIVELLAQRARPEEQGHLWHGQQVRHKAVD
jgi:hypothetical protein